MANHAETDVSTLQELVIGSKLRIIHNIYNFDNNHRIKYQLLMILADKVAHDKSIFWKSAIDHLLDLTQYYNIAMRTYFNYSKLKCKLLIQNYIQHKQQIM